MYGGKVAAVVVILILLGLGLIMCTSPQALPASASATPTLAYHVYLPYIVSEPTWTPTPIPTETQTYWWFWSQYDCDPGYWCNIIDAQMCLNTWDESNGDAYWFGCTSTGVGQHVFPYGHVIRWEEFPVFSSDYVCESGTRPCSGRLTMSTTVVTVDTYWRKP